MPEADNTDILPLFVPVIHTLLIAAAVLPHTSSGSPSDLYCSVENMRTIVFSNSALWRPWVFSSMDSTSDTQQKLGRMTDSDNDNAGKKGALGFQHPVRLYMPKSKTEEYLQHMGKKVLASFPVQATIHFYNDDSDSEEEDDYGMDYYNYYQNYKGREDQSMAEEDSAYSSGTDQSAK
ncbi:protein ripply3 isoform X2 [Hyla sarda]|uniref:protein ripply3 isoform X2 n=1 Tax=Hyla sarda TaxID=327740 RepID=UPI0024C40A55|nr:protein ripply3 isoform X2 [Hyla sarda]